MYLSGMCVYSGMKESECIFASLRGVRDISHTTLCINADRLPVTILAIPILSCLTEPTWDKCKVTPIAGVGAEMLLCRG